MHYIRNWFRACDERGLDMKIRIWHLNNAYEYLLEKLQLDDYPPATTHIAGIPVKMYEAILHCISTRFMLFNLSSTKSYNSRSISTLAVESFFSDLSRFEFGGLGAPNISHIVYINTTKHDPKRGFEFTTSTRDNYPIYLMEYPEDNSDSNEFKNHPFDKYRHIKKKRPKSNWFTLSKPKQVAKGGHGIRQYFKIDETRLTAEKHLGKNLDANEYSM